MLPTPGWKRLVSALTDLHWAEEDAVSAANVEVADAILELITETLAASANVDPQK